MNKKKQKPGPKEERLIIPGNWREAVKKSFEKEKPPEGWPQPEPKKKLPTAQPTATNKGNHAQT